MAPVQEVFAFYGQPATDGQEKLGIVKESEMKQKLPITRSDSVSYGVGTEEVCLCKTEFEFVDDKRQIRFEEKFDSFKKTQTISRNPSQITSPCVSYDLDEGQGKKLKTIQRSKGKKLAKKSAVENDDVSQFERDPFACKLKFVNGEKVSGKTIDLKSKDAGKNEIVLVPFSVEETEALESHAKQTVVSLPDSTKMQPEEERLLNEGNDCAEVQVEETLKLKAKEDVEPDIKQEHVLKRTTSKGGKRRITCVTHPNCSPEQCKKKKTGKGEKSTRQRLHKDVKPDIRKTRKTSSRGRGRRTLTSPSKDEPQDSGGAAGGTGTGNGNDSSGSSGSSRGGSDVFNPPGGSSHRRKAGRGDDSDDGEKGWKKPGLHLPKAQGKGSSDVDMEEEKQKSSEAERMDVDPSQQGLTAFSPSVVDNAEQCHDTSMAEPSLSPLKLSFIPSDLQHACYCSRQTCSNRKCRDVKAEVEHIKAHVDRMQCHRCRYTLGVVQEHAESCCMPRCRVPDCDRLREAHTRKKAATPQCSQAPSKQKPHLKMALGKPLQCSLNGKVYRDGEVLFENSKGLLPEPGGLFQEHTDYLVNRQELLGGGTYGKVHPVYLQSDRKRAVVVKETKYAVQPEEVQIYKLLEDHKHIVKHYGGTRRGIWGYASIFMERCGKSLFDIMDTRQKRLSLDEAMYYFLQVVDAVVYLHDLLIVHKDIKCKNVLTLEGRALLADFDSARVISEEFITGGKRGTEGFIAPEVLNNEPHGRPADIYSLGSLFIEMTVGVPTLETLQEKISKLKQLDPELADMVSACVSPDQNRRPTARQLAQWLVVRQYSLRA
ncbi:uncharacterized protein [Acropora muricata]|uniref:uncharacterized protein n=1 Tax=Acropora muricata TaxID=159855 RepID=UPI0034E55971